MTRGDDAPRDSSRPELLRLFKALADPVRLRMVGLLVERGRCGQELASLLGISAPTVSHHLRVLREAGLLREVRENPYRFYELDQSSLRSALREMSDRKRIRRFAEGAGLEPAKRKVLRTFFDGPRLVAIPAQRRKKEIVFEEILRRLPRRKVYSERELSRFIEAIHPDFCTIRRELIMGRYMERERGSYRLTEKGRAVLGEGAALRPRARG
jgi:biotin operon repressor